MKFLNLFKRKKFISNLGFSKIFYKGKEMQRDTSAKTTTIELDEDNEKLLDFRKIHSGGVRKVKHKQWSLDQGAGGRIVKTMPRNLRHMKEISEKTDE